MKALPLKSRWCAVALILSGAGCTAGSGDSDTTPAPAEKAGPETYNVYINKMAFFPPALTVRPGDKVTFINQDMVAHDVTEEQTRAWTSTPLPSNGTWTLTVTESANYYCSLHPVMKGRIIVQ